MNIDQEAKPAKNQNLAAINLKTTRKKKDPNPEIGVNGLHRQKNGIDPEIANNILNRAVSDLNQGKLL